MAFELKQMTLMVLAFFRIPCNVLSMMPGESLEGKNESFGVSHSTQQCTYFVITSPYRKMGEKYVCNLSGASLLPDSNV